MWVLFGRGGKCVGGVWERREVCGWCLGEEGSVWVVFGRGGKCEGGSDFNTLGRGQLTFVIVEKCMVHSIIVCNLILLLSQVLAVNNKTMNNE